MKESKRESKTEARSGKPGGGPETWAKTDWCQAERL